MKTIFDWLTVAAFVVLAILYLQRSSMPDPPDKAWHYIIPSLALGLANYTGNSGHVIASVAILTSAMLYTYYFIYNTKT